MNEKQFTAIANYLLRKPAQQAALSDILFNGLTHSAAERKHGCSGGSTYISLKSINRLLQVCNTVGDLQND